MAIDGIMLAAIKNDLKNKIKGARIDKIYQPESNLLTINLRQPGDNLKLLISNHPQRSRVHLTNLKFKNPQTPPDFCMLLRKYLINSNITDIQQPQFERILYLEIEIYDNIYYLILEIMGRYSNVILINENKLVLDAMKRINEDISSERQLYPGITYKAPPSQNKLNPLQINKNQFFNKIPDNYDQKCFQAILQHFRGIGPEMAKEIIYRGKIDYNQCYSNLNNKQCNQIFFSFMEIVNKIKNGNFNPTIGLKSNQNIDYTAAFNLKHKKNITQKKHFKDTGILFDFFYENEVKNKKLREFSKRLSNKVNKYLKKNEKQQRKFKGMMNDSKSADKYKKMGELLKANTHKINKKTKKIDVIDYFDSEQNKITINLDPDLSPGENVQRYFKKYNKAKKTKKYARRELGKLVHEEKYLNQVLLNIDQAETVVDLEEIEEELKDEGYIKTSKSRTKNKKNKHLPPRKFKSSQGYDIIVGRNNRQNDYITKKVANNHDIWLHTKEIPGAHVIIRNHTRDQIPLQSIEEAAVLAASFSKAKMSENVPVDYTKIKNVNKPKGAKPGLVYYNDYQTLYIDPDQKLVNELKVN